MFLTGLHIGEFCALQWKDVDLINNKLRISKSLSVITTKITSSKTPCSTRTIQLLNRLITDRLRHSVEMLRCTYTHIYKKVGRILWISLINYRLILKKED